MNTNRELVSYLYEKRTIRSGRIFTVMNQVDRKDFTKNDVLYDNPEPLILGQTISAPGIHANALEMLLPNCVSGNRVLDVGCGSGYLVGCFMRLLDVRNNPDSVVVGIDIYEGLVDLSKENLLKSHSSFLPKSLGGTNPNENVEIICGNGWKGYKKLGKYDVIHVGASSPTIPRHLLEQLNENGVMIIPIGSKYKLIKKNRSGALFFEDIQQVRFVPLINENEKSNELKNDTQYHSEQCKR